MGGAGFLARVSDTADGPIRRLGGCLAGVRAVPHIALQLG